MDKDKKRREFTLRFSDQLSPEEIESLLSLTVDAVDIPHDFKSPVWNFERRVHNWHGYAGEDLASLWESFTLLQKAAVAARLHIAAEREEWD